MDSKEVQRLQREMEAMTGGVPYDHWVVSTLRENRQMLLEIKSTVKWHWSSIAGLAVWVGALTVYVAYKVNGG